DHADIIQDAIRALKRDMLQTDLARNFLPEQFTLSELRDLLLTVCQEKSIVEKAAFFRKAPTLPFLTVVRDEEGKPKQTTRNSKRPSKLYTFCSEPSVASIYF
ncbi:MAG: NrtR DNA-binding winged helix domain-containing protein, partial [Bacilli bacterium]